MEGQEDKKTMRREWYQGDNVGVNTRVFSTDAQNARIGDPFNIFSSLPGSTTKTPASQHVSPIPPSPTLSSSSTLFFNNISSPLSCIAPVSYCILLSLLASYLSFLLEPAYRR
jgi:hypothetical protein